MNAFIKVDLHYILTEVACLILSQIHSSYETQIFFSVRLRSPRLLHLHVIHFTRFWLRITCNYYTGLLNDVDGTLRSLEWALHNSRR